MFTQHYHKSSRLIHTNSSCQTWSDISHTSYPIIAELFNTFPARIPCWCLQENSIILGRFEPPIWRLSFISSHLLLASFQQVQAVNGLLLLSKLLQTVSVTLVSCSVTCLLNSCTVQILNYALTLKHLEAKLYHDALENYTQAQFIAAGFPDPFYDYLREVTFDEITHVDYLNGLIGSSAVAECTYNFPATDVKSFVEFASVFEGIGASALLGQVASICKSDSLRLTLHTLLNLSKRTQEIC